jgi:hypothetical protein
MPTFDWRRDSIAMALPQCTTCEGLGLRETKAGVYPCNCVLRGIFRLCMNTFRQFARMDMGFVGVRLGLNKGTRRSTTWGRPREEYCADFYLAAKRALHGTEWEIFRMHYLEMRPWPVCSAAVGLDRGNFFHECYRLEAKLGRYFPTLEPFPLYPLEDYFSRQIPAADIATLSETPGEEAVIVVAARPKRPPPRRMLSLVKRRPVRPPLKAA